jgi:hypothetical protein
MGNEFGDESVVKTSYPDINSALKMHLGSDFCYDRREVDGSTIHVLRELKKGAWKDYATIEDKEIKGFDNDEIATFLILKVSMDRVIKRTTGGMLLLYFIIGVPVTFIISLALRISDAYSIEGLLITGGVMVPFIAICCLWSDSDEKSVDDRLYSIRPNFIAVLQKMKELKEVDTQKKILDGRIQRLQESRPSQIVD